MKKAGKLHNMWIITASVYLTCALCIKGIFKTLFGKFNHDWENKVTINWSDKMLNLIGAKCNIFNPHEVKPQKGQPTIIMCNHTSLYDIPLSFQIFRNHIIHMLAKKELSRIPIMGTAMKKVGYPFIDRQNRQKAIQDLNVVREILKNDIIIWIAPEGGRSQNGKLQKFKKGGFITAIHSEAIIIPVGIRGANQILSKKTSQFYLNCKPEIHIGKPVDASKYTLDNKEELIEVVHNNMQKLVGE